MTFASENIKLLNLPRRVVGQLISAFGPMKGKFGNEKNRLRIRWEETPESIGNGGPTADGNVIILSLSPSVAKKVRAAVVEEMARLHVTRVAAATLAKPAVSEEQQYLIDRFGQPESVTGN